MKRLEFEKPIAELYEKIDQLKTLSKDDNIELDIETEIGKIEERAAILKSGIYSNLSPAQIVQIARHPERPDTLSLTRIMFDDFTELHGDRVFGDDPSIVGGLAKFKRNRIMVIGHQKGHDTKENIKRNFGMPNPEGYRKALRLMKLAERFNLPIITFIDTPGAYPGIGAEERGQAQAIAENLKEMSKLKVPVISFVIGEGGSGGALGIGVCNKLHMMQFAIYSVISPEGCASILFNDAGKSELAAETMKITAKDIYELGVCDSIIKEVPGGAHNNWEKTAESISKVISAELKHYQKVSNPDIIIEERYTKFRNFGRFTEK